MSTEVREIFVTSDLSSGRGEGQIEIQTWDPKEQKKRALKAAGICVGLGCASVIIPIAHFALVPGFLLAAPLVYFFILKQKSQILGGKGSCPNCQGDIPISAGSHSFPMADFCPHCRKSLQIHLEN